MSEAKSPEPAAPNPSRRLRRWIWWMVLLGVFGAGLASGYGYWLTTDSVSAKFPLDAVVLLGGYKRHEVAASWVHENRCREIWLISGELTSIESLGVERTGTEIGQERLQQLGVSQSSISLFPANLHQRDVPSTIRVIGGIIQQRKARQIVVLCQPLEARFLRQITNAALDDATADKLSFLSLPSDRYRPMLWWLSRTGLKEAWNQTLQIFGNWWDGPTRGFEEIDWHPETWELPRAETAL